MSDYLEIDALVTGIVYADNTTKQALGRRFATYLGLNPGPSGQDEGSDGVGEVDGHRIYFQSKLERNPLDASRAAEFYGNLGLHQADIGVILAGVGYTDGFLQRLEKDPNLHQKFKIHPLTLA
ncbi:MAG: hypothetical protein VKJ46_16150, partial [Leptolyngbyaceae bacterium]|nr:hypothetical protein [Leptolyngbyaceae bacterium]